MCSEIPPDWGAKEGLQVKWDRRRLGKRLALLAAGGLLLGFLTWQDSQPPAGTYVMECGQEFAIAPSLELDAGQGQFRFMQDSLSSYWPYGEYWVEGDRLIAHCAIDENQYVFQIKDNRTLCFLAEESAEIHIWDPAFSPVISDGATFRRDAPTGGRHAPTGM